MPPPETFNRTQKALLWTKTGWDDYGQPTVHGTPEEIDVRWEKGYGERTFEKVERQDTDPQSSSIGFDGYIIVDRRVPVGSVLWLGAQEVWYGTGSGSGTGTDNEDTELYQVVSYREVPDLKGRHFRRSVGVMRLKAILPSFV